MKFVTLLSICILLVVGSITYSRYIATAGGMLFLMGEIVGLVREYRAARLYRDGRHEEWRKARSTRQRIIDAMWNWLAIMGLISIFVGDAINNEAMTISGWMLWIGRITSGFASGIIAREIAGIPLKMTYGGWKVRHPRRRR